MKVSIGKAAKELGVALETLRRWEAEGKIKVERTPGGHRRYDLASLRGWSRKGIATPGGQVELLEGGGTK